MRQKLGILKRAIQGFLLNTFERAPQIPAHLKGIIIGKSVKGRPIHAYVIGEGPQKVLFAGGMHGNEVGSVKLTHYLIEWLYQNKDKFKKFTFFVVPCLNPDGYSLAKKSPNYWGGGRIGRFNANSVDLNRNFDVPSFHSKSDWTHGKDYQERTAVFCGDKGGSEPETKALVDLTKKEKISIWFMFHTAGADVMGNDNELAQKLARIYSKKTKFNFYPLEKWPSLRQTGTAKEWTELNKVSYIEVEGSSRWGSDWKKQKPAIEAALAAI
tara:strand:+ start:138 stop:944 length:807 start_codon:yes stop_codon:yes gene_type:complete